VFILPLSRYPEIFSFLPPKISPYYGWTADFGYSLLLFGFTTAATTLLPSRHVPQQDRTRLGKLPTLLSLRFLSRGLLRADENDAKVKVPHSDDDVDLHLESSRVTRRISAPEAQQQMAHHESARTTGLYDRRNDQVSLDEVERIVI
jgi:hypothetical protein